MRALTLWQPWASQPFDRLNPKDVENRSALRPPEELWTNVWAPPEQPTPGVVRVDTGRRPFFAIHAGLRYDPAPLRRSQGIADPGWPFPPGVPVPPKERLPFGAVVGVVRLRHAFDARTQTTIGVDDPPAGIVECKALTLSRWWLGPIGWRLEHAIPIEPLPIRGALGVWTLPDDVAREVSRRALRAVNEELTGRAYAGAPGAPEHHVDVMPRMRVIDLVRASEDLRLGAGA